MNGFPLYLALMNATKDKHGLEKDNKDTSFSPQ